MDHPRGLVLRRPQAASPRRAVVYFCSAVLSRAVSGPCASRIPNSLGRIRPTCVASAQCGPRRVVARHGARPHRRGMCAACVARQPPGIRQTPGGRRLRCTRLSVLARHAAVAVERLAASGRLPVACVAVSARQTAASVAVGRARGDHRPDERVALPRVVVVYPRGAEPGLARPARRRRRCLQGRPPVGRAGGSRAAFWRPHGVTEDGFRSRQRGARPRPQPTRIFWWGTSHRMLSRLRPASRHAPRFSSRWGSSPPVR